MQPTASTWQYYTKPMFYIGFTEGFVKFSLVNRRDTRRNAGSCLNFVQSHALFLFSLTSLPPLDSSLGKFPTFRSILARGLADHGRGRQQRGQRLLLPTHRGHDVLPAAAAGSPCAPKLAGHAGGHGTGRHHGTDHRGLSGLHHGIVDGSRPVDTRLAGVAS